MSTFSAFWLLLCISVAILSQTVGAHTPATDSSYSLRAMSSSTGVGAVASRPQPPPFNNLEEELKHKLAELTHKLAEKDDWITGLTLQKHKLQKQFEEEAEGGLEHSLMLFHAEKDRMIAQTECAELAKANGELRGRISDLQEDLADAEAGRAAANERVNTVVRELDFVRELSGRLSQQLLDMRRP